MDVRLLPPDHPSWNSELERLGLELDATNNPTTFPFHFLSVVLRRIGGYLMLVEESRETGGLGETRRLGCGFLFPRHTSDADGSSLHGRAFTLRYHPLIPTEQPEPTYITALVQEQLGGTPVTFYRPNAPQHYAPTYRQIGVVNVGRPSAEEAVQVRRLQGEIWGSPPEFLYPADIHSVDFRLGTTLVARVDDELAGFLFGVTKFGGPALPANWHSRFNGDLRLESQTMGVHPRFRGMRIGNILKRVQAEDAWEQGIGIVNWTVDPLQYPNAALNFGLLRAMAFDFYPDLYPFRNDLNRVHASRFAITWLVGTRHVRDEPLVGSRALILDLAHQRHIARVNRQWTDVNYTVDNQFIAIEVPADWTTLQQTDIDAAMAWRSVTDRIFQHYVGRGPGKYVITGVGVHGEQRYLIGERTGDELWTHLGSV